MTKEKAKKPPFRDYFTLKQRFLFYKKIQYSLDRHCFFQLK